MTHIKIICQYATLCGKRINHYTLPIPFIKIDNLSIKIGKCIMDITGSFEPKVSYKSDDFNSKKLTDDLYILAVRTTYLGNSSILFRVDTKEFRSSIIHSDAKSSLIVINSGGFTIYGQTEEITQILIYKIKIK